MLNILDRFTSFLLAAAVIVAARIWLGDWWFLWAVGALAAMSAWREAGRLYLRPLPPALRRVIAGPPQEAAEPLKEMASRHGLRYPAVVFWPQEQLPAGAPAAYVLIQGRPVFLVGDGLEELLTRGEIQSAFAHELAHHLLGHAKRFAIARALADAAAGAAACVPASFLPIASSAGWDLLQPAATILAVLVGARACLQVALNAYSRRQELGADRKALQITADAEAFISSCRALAAARGAQNDPPRWAHWLLSDSPTLRERLAVAERHSPAARQ